MRRLFGTLAFGDPLPGDPAGLQERVEAWERGQRALALIAAGLASGALAAAWWAFALPALGMPQGGVEHALAAGIPILGCFLAGNLVAEARRLDAGRMIDRLGDEWAAYKEGRR